MLNKIKNKINKSNILKNSLIIMCGQTGASIINFINTFLVIQAVGVYGNGIIAVVQTYTNIFNGIFNFQSYNAMIKFGADALERENLQQFKKYIKQALVQDLITAILSIVCGYICIDLVANFMKWDSQIVFLIKLHLITIIFTITGSINGVLRLFNEFKIGAIINIKTAIVKVILVIVTMILNLDIIYYIIIEIIIAIMSSVLLFRAGYKCLKENDCLDFLKVNISFDKEFTMFNIHNNLVSTIDMPVGQLTTLIINKLLGISEVGTYNILVKVGGLLTKITEPVTQALLPELSKIVAKGEIKRAFSIVKKIFIYTIGLGVAVVIGISLSYKLWLGLLIEPNMRNVSLLILYILYIILVSAFSGIHLMFICLNLVRYNLLIVSISNIAYLIILYALTLKYGLFGIIISLIFQAVVVVLFKYVIVKIKKI